MTTNSRFAPRPTIWTAVLLLVAVIGWADYATGYEIHFSALYTAPIGIAAWYLTFGEAFLIAVLCAVVQFAADYYSGLVYS